MESSKVPKFRGEISPQIAKRESYNNDFRLGRYAQSKVVCAGSQKKGPSPAINDPVDYPDHILRAIAAGFPLGVDIPSLRMFSPLLTGLLPLLLRQLKNFGLPNSTG